MQKLQKKKTVSEPNRADAFLLHPGVKGAQLLPCWKDLKNQRGAAVLSHLRRSFHFFAALTHLKPRAPDETRVSPTMAWPIEDTVLSSPVSPCTHGQYSCQHGIVRQRKWHLNHVFLSKLWEPGKKVKKKSNVFDIFLTDYNVTRVQLISY